MMALLQALGLDPAALAALKGAAKLLLLPPTPLLLVWALGAWLAHRGRRGGRWLQGLAWAGLWAVCTPLGGDALLQWLTRPPPALTAAQRQALVGAPHTAVLVLGGGRVPLRPEYGGPDLQPLTHERLRYGVWLARQTGLPLGYSGGLSPGADPGPSEAEVARQVVAQHHPGVVLRWREARSLDTDGNARESLALLARDGIQRIVLVTHGAHQRRALAAFARAAAAQQQPVQLLPAPVGLPQASGRRLADWVPSYKGLAASWLAVYEALGYLAGA